MSQRDNNLQGVEDLVDRLHEQERRLEKIERSGDLGHSAIDSGALVVKDSDGNEAFRIGQNDHGVITTQYRTGPIPNQPSTPIVEFGVGSFNVTWDGLDAGGNPAPKDFKELNIYASLEPEFEANAGTYRGVVATAKGGTKTIALPYGTYYIRTAIHTMSGQTGPVSELVSGDILSVVELPDVAEEFAQGRADMEALGGKLTDANQELARASDRLKAAEDILTPLPGNLEAIRKEAQDAVTAAEQARAEALAAQTAATEANARSLTVLENGSFEDDLKGWQTIVGKTAPTITTDSYVGGKAAQFANNQGVMLVKSVPVIEGQVWEVSAYTKSTSGTAPVGGIYVDFVDAQAKIPKSTQTIATPNTSKTTWARVSARYTVPAGMDFLDIRIDYSTGGHIVDEMTARDVTDVVRLEKAAQDAATKAQNALDKASLLETKVATLEVGQKAVSDRLTKAEADLTANKATASAELSDLNKALREAFADADASTLASASSLATKAKDDAVTAAKADAQAKADKALADAKAAALVTARAEAQREADEAQAAAEAYAKAQATGASATALADAKAYAEKEAAEAEAAAKAFATAEADAKASAAQAEATRLAALDAKAKADKALADANAVSQGLPKVQHGTTTPSAAAPEGSVYFQHEGAVTGRVVGQWVRSGNAWTSTPLTSAAIANLDVGKLTAGSAVIDTAVLNKVWADLGVFNRLTAGEAWIGGAQIKDGAITAEKITVTDTLVANILGANTVVADKLVANGNLWARAAQILTLDASKLTVTDTATINEAVINKIWAQSAVIDRLTSGEAWIGNTVIKDGAITAPKIRADSIDASHLRAKAVKADNLDFETVDPTTGGSLSLDATGLVLKREGSTIFQLTNAGLDTIALTDSTGATTAALSNDGRITGGAASFDSLTVGGEDFGAWMDTRARGLIASAVRSSNPPNTQVSKTNDHINAVMRLEFDYRAGYSYEISADNLNAYIDVNDGATRALFLMQLRTDGTYAQPGDRAKALARTGIRSAGSSDTDTVSMKYLFHAKTSGTASVMISYRRMGGPASTTVMINPSDIAPYVLTVSESLGIANTGKVDFLGAVNAPSAGGTPVDDNSVSERRETQTWVASAAASWAGSSPYSTTYAGSAKDLWQGYWSGSPQPRRSHIIYGGLGDKGKSIASARLKMTSLEKLEIYLYNSFFYYYAGGTVRIHYHNSTSTSAFPSNPTFIGDVKMGRGEGKWIEITNANAKAAFMNGTFTGIAIDPRGSTDLAYYGAFKGTDGGSYAPKIRATYLTT